MFANFLSNIHPARYGDALRPTPKIDEKYRWTRGVIYLLAVLAVIVSCAVVLAYYSLNPGLKTETAKEVDIDKIDALIERVIDDEIFELECKCIHPLKEYYPEWKDNGGYGPEDLGTCIFESPMYLRCVESIPLAKTAQAVMTCSPCECDESEYIYAQVMCYKLVKSFAADYNSRFTKVTSLQGKHDWLEDAVSTYVDVCHTKVTETADGIRVLQKTMELVPGVDISNFQTTAIEGFADPLEDAASVICAEPQWDEASDTFTGDGGEFGPLWAVESTRIAVNLQYNNENAENDDDRGHYQKCSPTTCSYKEEEGWKDFLLKTFALGGSILTAVMVIAAGAYGMLDNHWDEAEEALRKHTGEGEISSAAL
jgi:hypothetical protein